MTYTPVFKRFYTPEEANGALINLRPLLRMARRLLHEINQAERDLHPTNSDDVRSDAYCRIEENRIQVNQLLTDLRHEGVMIVGLEPISVHFPAMRNGQEVRLSWIEGEQMICSWHHLHTDQSKRYPVNPQTLGVWEWCN